MESRKKLMRVTTADISLDGLLKGQLRFLGENLEVVGVASDTGVISKVAEREKIRTVSVSMHREISLLADLRSLFALYRLFRRERPDIVHANTPKGSLLSMLAAKAARVPNRLYTVTGLRFETAGGNFRRLLVAMERLSCACATRVIPEGDGVKRKLIENRITGKPLEKIHYGNISGIDLDFFRRTPQVEAEAAEIRRSVGGSFIFLFIGRIVGDKGINELLRAFTRLYGEHPEARLILVGNREPQLDPLPPESISIVEEHPAIFAPGRKDDVRPWLAAADVLVLPSYREGFPNVVLQAGAMDVASLVTDVNGANEVIEEGSNGHIVPIRDEEALLAAMRSMASSPEAVKEMGMRSRRVIEERFDCRDVWAELLRMYRSL